MSSKKAPMKSAPHSGQKRAAAAKSQSTPAKKPRTGPVTPAAPATPKFAPPASDEDDDDDDAAIMALKANAGKVAPSAPSDEDDFEVAGVDEDEEDDSAPPAAPNAPPSDDDDDDVDAAGDDDAAMRDADESDDQLTAPIPKAKKSVASTTPVTPSSSKNPTTPKPTSTNTPATQTKQIAKATTATKPTTPKAAIVESDSETSDDDDDAKEVAPRPVASKSTVPSSKSTPPATKSTTPSTPTPAKSALSTLGDSSESSDDEDATSAAAIAAAAAKIHRKVPAAIVKPTPLQGDASVNPPPKKVVKPNPAPTSSTFEKPLTRPPTAPHTGRKFTVSIALPGSIVGNAQSKELRTYVAGQIARAAATFNVDEIVVFSESGKQVSSGISGNFEGATRSTDPDVFLARILQYLETPQYLRKSLFPKHADLALAGLLNPLDSPHHVRIDEECTYREGVVVKRPVAGEKKDQGCWANIGLKNEAFIDRPIEVGTRLTVHIPQVSGSTTRKTVSGRAVAPSTPREKNGTYWGYTTRLAQSLSQVWSECPFASDGGYDLSIGTSEHGEDVHSNSFELPPFKHAIIFFGGLAGLEEHIGADETISVKRPEELFQLYINSVIGQGCRTIRTEEAIPITLAALYRHVRTNQPPTTE